MRIGELAQRTGLSVHTLRFYERRGLLPRAPRESSNYRDYPPRWLERLTFIREAQRLGFTLAEIRELLDGADAPVTCAHLRTKGQQKVREIEAELRRLRQIRTALQALLRGCQPAPSAPSCAVSALVVTVRKT